ncbi:MAG: F0F1 ATP synthase subunit A, partial [Lachnospiraceae bacterium]|nr:F0F1 ATP synthase subunit A [Lachnospiraceae bacterium]
MGNLGESLMEELTCETVFTVGGIGISESVVVTWIIMAVFLIAALLLTRNLKVENPGRGQLMLEYAITWLQGVVEGIIGEEGKEYVPYLASILIYIGTANLIGILGFKPPTKD